VPTIRPRAQIEKFLHSQAQDEAFALDYLTLLNLSGLDIKGQLSMAHGQAGIGLKVDVGVDFGALIMPFLHLKLGAGAGGEATADALLLLHRLASRWWLADMPQPPQSPERDREQKPPPFPVPDWSTREPLVMAFLRGTSWRLAVNAEAQASFGVGNFDDPDETGLAVGAGATADGEMRITRLIDPKARHYPPTPSDSTLCQDMALLFSDRLKAHAAAWLIGTGGGVKELIEFGAPPRSRTAQVADAGLTPAKAVAALLARYDEMTIPDVDAVSLSGSFGTALKGLRAVARQVRDRLRKNKLTTDDLLKALAGAQTELASWLKSLEEPAAVGIYGARLLPPMQALARQRLAQARRYQAALKDRKDRKLNKTKPAAVPTSVLQLDIATYEAHGRAAAGAKLVLPRDMLTVQLSASAEARYRRHCFRYQAQAPSAGDRTLRWTQDTVVTYATRQLQAVAQAKGRGYLKERNNLVTMAYRSALAQWFDTGPNARQALPCGSGLSFGMSVLSESFGRYARECRDLAPKGPLDPRLPPLAPELVDLEQALVQQLRVDADDLRTFMRNCWGGVDQVAASADAAEPIDSFIVESAHALTAPLDIFDPTQPRRWPLQLLELPTFTAFAKTAKPAAANPTLRLQAIRLRFPLRQQAGSSTSLVQLGWNPEPWGEDAPGTGEEEPKSLIERLTGFDSLKPKDDVKLSALAVEVGVEIELIRRVCAEGIVELHQQLYPHPYSHKDPPSGYGRERAKALEGRHHAEFCEALVPPVALFAQ
jgi:hypothetical protein